jgi:hypothetical protein
MYLSKLLRFLIFVQPFSQLREKSSSGMEINFKNMSIPIFNFSLSYLFKINYFLMIYFSKQELIL